MNNAEPQVDPLVDLSGYGFILEPVYFNEGLSADSKMYLRKSVAEKLARIQAVLGGYRLKIWDGYRPPEVQKALYESLASELMMQFPDWSPAEVNEEASKFVAYPYDAAHTPPHATGGTVDLTLTDADGMELDMGTAFDHFGLESAPLYFEENDTNPVARANRKILRDAMFAEDFSPNAHEWWHFDYGNWKWAEAAGKSPLFDAVPLS